MGAGDDKKVTPGITELSRLRAQTFVRDKCHEQSEYIDGEACYIDVGSSYPGRAESLRAEALLTVGGQG